MNPPEIKVSGVGWVLPWAIGAGERPPAAPPRFRAADSELGAFKPKDYLNSVKGYLDPVAGYLLASAALALGEWRERFAGSAVHDDAGVVSVTFFGAQFSAYRFYQQFASKGPRWASPMIFPHGYPNTAGNLVAIEFGFGGPHMVFSASNASAAAFRFARMRLMDGSARHMLVLAGEASRPDALPDDAPAILDGGLALWLSVQEDAPTVGTPESVLASGEAAENAQGACGAVAAMLGFLGAQPPD